MKKSTLIPCLILWACCGAAAENRTPGAQDPISGSLPHPKKGIGLTTSQQNRGRWKAQVEALSVSWHYSWETSLPEAEPPGVEFVPMLWGYWGPRQEFRRRMAELVGAPAAQRRHHLLGFNEPDNKQQAHMSVQQALEGWQYLLQTGLRLGSPAAVHAHQAWLRKFMQHAKEEHLRVDFVCVHWYGAPNAEEFLRYLSKIHSIYGKPVWITEFAVADWQAKSRHHNRYSPDSVLHFMQAILPRLDALPFVERYAWFSPDEDDRALGPSALFTADGALTALGRYYASHPYAPPPANEAGVQQTTTRG